MSLRKRLYSRHVFFANLVTTGLILGFTLSMILFSCSTRAQPGDRASADEISSHGIESLESLQVSFRAISKSVRPSVVKITVEETRTQSSPGRNLPWFDFFFRTPDGEDEDHEFRTQGLGSGVVVQKNGSRYYVLTNDHVIGEADQILIILDDGSEYPGEVIGKDIRKDLALISFEAPDSSIPVARLGDSNTLQVGDWVLAIGSPFGFQSTVTAGIVSALGRRGGPQGNISDFIQTDAAINQGNSGGALVNLAGEVVGINTWITSQTGGSVGIGFSIPINNARRAIDEFIEHGEVQYGWLGVSIRSVVPEVAESLGLENRNGALVQHVFIGSPAARDGILPGDFVTSVNNSVVENQDELILAVGDLPVGEEAVFHLLRQGSPVTVTVTIAVREDERRIAEQNRNLWPGMSAFPLTQEIKTELDIEDPGAGVIISGVENRTPASISGVRVGDLIISINKRTIHNLREFYEEINRGNGTLEIELIRDGQSKQVVVKQ
jgi:Do/DeqQ family serine protease